MAKARVEIPKFIQGSLVRGRYILMGKFLSLFIFAALFLRATNSFAAVDCPELYSYFLDAQKPVVSAQNQIIDAVGAQQFAAREYGRAGSRMYRTLKSYGDDYLPLLGDLGLMNYFKEFSDFLKTRPRMPALEARARFSNSLGTKKVYRSLALTEEEAQKILRGGMDSPIANNISDPTELSAALMAELNEGTVKSLHRRYPRGPGNNLANNPFMSVSDYPDLAASVALQSKTPEKSVHIFEMEVPRVDLIEPGKNISYPWHISLARFLRLKSVTTHPDQTKSIYRFGPNVESFVSFRIPASAIKRAFRDDHEQAPKFSSALKAPLQQVDPELFLSRMKSLPLHNP